MKHKCYPLDYPFNAVMDASYGHIKLNAKINNFNPSETGLSMEDLDKCKPFCIKIRTFLFLKFIISRYFKFRKVFSNYTF